jgi:alkylation response protein AidB-like acyl-CoA dehydrogenase
MFDSGWLVPGWPPQLGGRDAGPIETLVYLEELTKAHIPRTTNPQGLGIIVPSILDFGSDESRREWGLRMILVSRCLERIGDHAVDIGEQTAYLVTGEFREFTDASHPEGS